MTTITTSIQQHHPPTLETTLPRVTTATLPQTSLATNSTMMPAIPNLIQDWMLHGEFFDFATLLLQAMFTGGHIKPTKTSTDANEPLSHSPSIGKQ